MDMYTSVLQFTSLQQNMVEGMEPIIAQFGSLVDEMKRKPYDLLDYTRNNFDRDFLEFNVNVSEVEAALQTFVNGCFDNIQSTQQALSLLKRFETVLQRETLQSDLESKHTGICVCVCVCVCVCLMCI